MTDWLKSLFGNAPEEVKQDYGYTDVAPPPAMPEAPAVQPLGVDPVTNSTHMAESLPIRASTGNPQDNYNFSDEGDFQEALDSVSPNEAPVPQATSQESSQQMKLIQQLLDRKPRLLSMPAPTKDDNTPMSLEAGDGSGQNSMEALQGAQSSKNWAQLVNNLGAAGSQYVAGSAGFGAKADTSGFDKLNQQAEGIVKDQQLRGEQEKKDPNSPVSKAYKQYLKDKFKVEVKGDVSADQLEKLYPMIQRSFENEESRKSREEQNRMTIQGINERSLNSAEDRKASLMTSLMNKQASADLRKQGQEDQNNRFGRTEVLKYQQDAERQTAKMRDAIAEAGKFGNMMDLALTNPQAANQLGITLAKALGETGALSAADVTRYIGRKDIAGKVEATAKELAEGTLSEENKQYLGETLKVLERVSKERMKSAYVRQSERFAQNLGIPLEEAIKKVVPNSEAGMLGLTSQAPEGRIAVISPDGKTGHIKKEELKQHLERGFKEIK